MFAKLFAYIVFLIRNVFVTFLKKTLGWLQKRLFCENKPSAVIAYNFKHKKKSKVKMKTFVQCRIRNHVGPGDYFSSSEFVFVEILVTFEIILYDVYYHWR